MGLGDDLMITGIVEQEHRKHPDKFTISLIFSEYSNLPL